MIPQADKITLDYIIENYLAYVHEKIMEEITNHDELSDLSIRMYKNDIKRAKDLRERLCYDS